MKTPFVVVALGLGLLSGPPAFAADLKFPSQKRTLAALTPAGFTEPPVQIPATVIDVGRLRFVPYTSYQVGGDREVNIYGDPAAPACVEIGLYRSLLNSNQEKVRCVTFLRQLFPAIDFSTIRLTGGKILRGGVVVEVTMPDAPDAYGGWWISVYSLPLLQQSAANIALIPQLTVRRDQAGATAEWTPVDMQRARPSAGDAGALVYVRSFLRKGTDYVKGLAGSE
jgi:hypothetical protein